MLLFVYVLGKQRKVLP